MSHIPAGDPEEDDSDAFESLDFNRDILNHPESLVYALVDGDSMVDIGISRGSLLVVDRDAEVQDGCVAIIVINGKRTVKKIEKCGVKFRLISANRAYEPIEIDPTQRLEVFGVVQYSIRCHKLGNKHAAFRVR